MKVVESIVNRTRRFAEDVGSTELSFHGYVYNPLEYAWDIHEQYLRRYVRPEAEIMFMGMNPGPFGMVQTGVPFGEVEAVRSWLGLYGPVGHPSPEHPGRPVEGFSCRRSEVSGQRLWGLMKERFGSPDIFFSRHCVMNYCPLAFLDSGPRARNVPVDVLPADERRRLEDICSAYIADIITMVNPRALVGVGGYARKKLENIIRGMSLSGHSLPMVTGILHPSPGNPAANKGWAQQASDALEKAGLWNPVPAGSTAG
ncbi:uracil-DNA glycosylase family protein [Parasphaerochaeta coccoides]|uniref:Uracil-DNA glycosylase superfamily n=1 Tax=Parasphaerochaeta coccoides (strain ATCC BAA-1237 / DSM 17374 / SPN1) TaxID=760011 RepID=F4GJD6_PARC1|nr:uracil-DNA glycosylase family protein [Parasphaerochaeta coccoides]AEC02201.1 Uracil-DNA glycosylase superfamily [Parasphaerochaeta coccoides DSM 17374]